MNLRFFPPFLFVLFLGTFGSFLFAKNQASQKNLQWHKVFVSHVEERSQVIKNILSGNQNYIKQAIDSNKYSLGQEKPPSSNIKQPIKQNSDNPIVWNHFYQTVEELVGKHNNLCELIIIKQNETCILALSYMLTKYHIVIDEIGRDTFYQYHIYNWPHRSSMNKQPGFIVKVNVLKGLLKAVSALSPGGIAVTVEEKISGFSKQLMPDAQIKFASEKMNFRDDFTQEGKQWILKYSATEQYPHRLLNVNKYSLFSMAIVLLLSLFIFSISHYFFRFHKLAKKNQINIMKLTEVNKISGLGFWEWDIQTNQISWSDEVYKIFNLKKNENELTYELFLSRIHPEDRVVVTEKVNAALKNDEKYEIKHRIFDSVGNILHIHEKATVTFDSTGQAIKMLGTVQDITSEIKIKNKWIVSKSELEHAILLKTNELRKSNIQLKQERNKAQQYLDIANVILLVIDKAGKILLINKKGQETLGYTEDELLGKNWFEQCIPESIRDTLQEKHCFHINNHTNSPDYYENNVITKQGEIRSIAWHNAVLNSDYGEGFATISSGTDETKLKNSLELLGHKQQSLNAFFDSDLIGVINLSSQGIILSINHYVCSLTGYTSKDLINKKFTILLSNKEDTLSWLQNHSQNQGNSFSLTLINKNSQSVFTYIFLKPVFDSDGQLQQFLCLVTDVSEKVEENKRLLEQEKKHKKILVREVHHRIKNHLQGVTGLIQNYELEHPEAREILKKSRMQINSLAEAYGLQSSNSNGEIYLCDILNTSVKFCQHLLLTDKKEMIFSRPHGKAFRLMEEQAVPITLIINELLLNAVKHSSQSSIPILVSLSIDDDRNALIKIVNDGSQLPKDFNYELNRGLGTGLELLKTLTPEKANLKINNIDSKTVAEFCIKKPLIAYSL